MIVGEQTIGVRRSLCIGLVAGLLVVEGGMLLLRVVAFGACTEAGRWADPLILADRLREGAAFALVMHLAVVGGLVAVSLVRPSLVAPRFAVWALFAMTVWIAAYLVQGLDQISECVALQTLHMSVPPLLDKLQGPSILVLGLVFFVTMHVCLCMALLRPALDDR